MRYFVAEIDDSGMPSRLREVEGFDQALHLATNIAKENGISESDFVIYGDELAGVFYEKEPTGDVSGVWVVASE